jgi:hypothetical protein
MPSRQEPPPSGVGMIYVFDPQMRIKLQQRFANDDGVSGIVIQDEDLAHGISD